MNKDSQTNTTAIDANTKLLAAFSKPFEITNNVNVRALIPKEKEIPQEFDSYYNKWNKAVSTWFYNGINKSAFVAKDGIDKDKAFRHLATVISDWGFSHEHKTAGAAFLMSLWFEDVKLK